MAGSTTKAAPPEQLNLDLGIEVERNVAGIEMGVLENGIAYLTQSGLSEASGAGTATIFDLAAEWERTAGSEVIDPATRVGWLRTRLAEEGYREPRLFIEVQRNNSPHHAYPDVVCVAVIEYFAIEARQTNDTARRNLGAIARRWPSGLHLQRMRRTVSRIRRAGGSLPQWRGGRLRAALVQRRRGTIAGQDGHCDQPADGAGAEQPHAGRPRRPCPPSQLPGGFEQPRRLVGGDCRGCEHQDDERDQDGAHGATVRGTGRSCGPRRDCITDKDGRTRRLKARRVRPVRPVRRGGACGRGACAAGTGRGGRASSRGLRPDPR